MIRAAVKEDIPRLIEIGKTMHAEARRFKKFTYVPAKVYLVLSNLVDNENGFLRVAVQDGEVVGGLAAAVEPQWFSTGMMAYDMGLFILPEKRGTPAAAEMVTQYVTWAREKNAVITQFGISTGVHIASTGALLEHLGFKPSGFLYDYVGD